MKLCENKVALITSATRGIGTWPVQRNWQRTALKYIWQSEDWDAGQKVADETLQKADRQELSTLMQTKKRPLPPWWMRLLQKKAELTSWSTIMVLPMLRLTLTW